MLEICINLDMNVMIFKYDRGGKYYGRCDESGQYSGPFAKFLEGHDVCVQYTMLSTPQ